MDKMEAVDKAQLEEELQSHNSRAKSDKEKQIESLTNSFNIWSQNPTTKTFVNILRDHENDWIRRIINESHNPNVDDATIRRYGVALRNTKTILELATNAKLFVGNIIKE